MTAKRSETSTPDLCQFFFADGRLCRMLRAKDHPTLCLFHAREEDQLVESHRLGAELPAFLPGNFFNAPDIHDVLGKLFTARARNRISQGDAATLAYIAQLMLQTIPTASTTPNLLSPLKSALPQNVPITLLESALPNLKDLKSH
jgi:hypothetical protein